MNREILFKGRALETYGAVKKGDWVTSSTIVTNGVKVSLGVGYDEDSVITIPVDPETVGQYTGLKDMNGVKIFEGDVVKKRYYPLNACESVIEYYKTGVVQYDGSVMAKTEGTRVLDESRKSFHHETREIQYRHPTAGIDWIDRDWYLFKSEVTGNIHED